MSIRKVRRYQTKDRVIHDTKEKAQLHIVTQLENVIGPMVDKVCSGGVSGRDKINIVAALVGTPAKAKELKAILDKFV